MSKKKPVLLMILDGWGLRDSEDYNAIKLASTPNMDKLLHEWPNCRLEASGEAVGLPYGQMGNSEVGHLNIGAGRIVYQDLTRISKAIREGSFFQNQILLAAMTKAKEKDSALHLMGLLSDGGVHSHIEHLFALLQMAKNQGLEKVYVHTLLDGRDTLPQSGLGFIKELEDKIKEIGVGEIATVSGRYYAMDRDNRWERVEKAYKALALRDGQTALNAQQGVAASYENGVTDEFVVPFCVQSSSCTGINSDDAFIFFNFRSDRAREITRSIALKDFTFFARDEKRLPEDFVCMTEYDSTFNLPLAFAPDDITNTLGEVIAQNGLRQLRIAETEKYAHVTFFFNGGVEIPNVNEDRVLIPSPKVATYDLQPEMSAYLVTQKVLELIDEDRYDVIIMNYANSDMVGHTGILEAAEKAVATVDSCMGKVVAGILAKEGVLCITADHGNAEQMREEGSTQPHTAHTSNKVPFLLIGERYRNSSLHDGILADIAPTLLELLGLKKPGEMTGDSLINR